MPKVYLRIDLTAEDFDEVGQKRGVIWVSATREPPPSDYFLTNWRCDHEGCKNLFQYSLARLRGMRPGERLCAACPPLKKKIAGSKKKKSAKVKKANKEKPAKPKKVRTKAKVKKKKKAKKPPRDKNAAFLAELDAKLAARKARGGSARLVPLDSGEEPYVLQPRSPEQTRNEAAYMANLAQLREQGRRALGLK